MTRLTARFLAGSVALVMLSACTQQHAPPPQVANNLSTASSVPIGSQSAATTDSRSEISRTAASPSAAAPCDLVAHGEDGIPTERDAPLLVVRFGSYWGFSKQYAPVLVIYRSGAVAVAQTAGAPAADTGSTHESPVPFRPYLGGKFSQCAVDRLMAEYDEFARIELGSASVVDCNVATIQRSGKGRAVASRIVLDGFGCEGEVRYSTGEDRALRAARDRLVAWFARARTLDNGRSLPMDNVFLVADGHAYPIASNRKVIPWTAAQFDPHRACKRLTGSAASRALTQVTASMEAEPVRDTLPFVYTARWLVAGKQKKFDVMVVPPGITCNRGAMG